MGEASRPDGAGASAPAPRGTVTAAHVPLHPHGSGGKIQHLHVNRGWLGRKSGALERWGRRAGAPLRGRPGSGPPSGNPRRCTCRKEPGRGPFCRPSRPPRGRPRRCGNGWPRSGGRCRSRPCPPMRPWWGSGAGWPAGQAAGAARPGSGGGGRRHRPGPAARRRLGGSCVVLDRERSIARLVLRGWTVDLARRWRGGSGHRSAAPRLHRQCHRPAAATRNAPGGSHRRPGGPGAA